MTTLGITARLVRLIMLRAQETRHVGRYSQEDCSTSNKLILFAQAQTESKDFESFFGLFPEYLIKEALIGKEMLDFGSGYGGRTVEYKLCGAKRVCGIEPFENMIELSRRYAESRGLDVEFKVCGHREIPYPDESFDIVLSYDVLEHVEDPRVSIAEIRRVLRPGGLSLNVFPVYYGARSHHLDYIMNVPGLHWLFSARTLVNAVNSILSENPHFGTTVNGVVTRQPEPRRSFDESYYVLPNLNGLSGWHLKELFEGFETISLVRHPIRSSKPRLTRIAAAVAPSSLPTIIRDAATQSVACVLRKPGPSDTAPLSATSQIPITPLKRTSWTLISPAHLNDDRITIRGTVPHAGSYAAVSRTYLLPKGTRVGAAGTVRRGGFGFGLLDSNDQWPAQVAIPRGSFRKFIEAPAEGTYRIVISNNLPAGETINDVDVDEIGFVGLDPAQQRVGPPAQIREIAQITPFEVDAWETVFPATRQEGKGLRIEGEPASALAYGAVSVPYQLTKGVLVAAAGTVRRGGIVLGLLDNNSQQWTVTTAIEEGAFRTGVEVPVAGTYRIVISNNLPAGETINDVDVDEIGFVGLDPAQQRVGPPAQIREIAQITPFEVDAWETVFPATRQEGKGLRIEGEPASALAYGAVSVPYQLTKGVLVAAAGTVRRGGIVLGLLDNNSQQWTVTTAIEEGAFRTGVEVPVAGTYRIVISNNLPAGETINDVDVDEIGFVGLDPAQQRVGPPAQICEIAQITPFEVDAWETVFPATRQEGKGLRIEGEPASALAYGAVSVPYQLTKGVLVAAAGTVRRGGIVLGLLDNNSQQWTVTTAIEEGAFRTGVEVPVAGTYRIVISNNLPAGETINDVDVDEIGFVGLDPAEHRIRAEPVASQSSWHSRLVRRAG